MNPQWEQWVAEAAQKLQETYTKMEQAWVPQASEPQPLPTDQKMPTNQPMDKPMMEA